MEINTTEKLRIYLKEANVEYESLQRLEGGTANFVWRLVIASGNTMIIKHAEQYVASSAGQMPFPVDRMDFENAALKTVPDYVINKQSVGVPKVFWYDGADHVLSIEDGGLRNLKAAYDDQSLDIQKVGRYLGRWLSDLHANTKTAGIGDNKTAKAIYRYSYANVPGVLERYGHDPALGEQVNEQYGSLLQTDDECVCHGDFWPGNVLVEGQKLTVVDWEMVRRGCGATDVGQFAAEAYLLDKFKGGRGLLQRFLSAYREDTNSDARFLQRVAIHMGVHLAFWPTRVHWGTEDETRECVEVGNELMMRALGDENGWASDSLLKDLL